MVDICMLKCMFQNNLSLKESRSIITEVGLSASFLSRSISTALVTQASSPLWRLRTVAELADIYLQLQHTGDTAGSILQGQGQPCLV